jgi:hypothetical protein
MRCVSRTGLRKIPKRKHEVVRGGGCPLRRLQRLRPREKRVNPLLNRVTLETVALNPLSHVPETIVAWYRPPGPLAIGTAQFPWPCFTEPASDT